jgi:hypothetical protein
LDTKSGSVDSLLQTVESTEILVDLIGERSRRREFSSSVRGRGEVLPEERVVDVSSTVELDGGLESDRLLDVLSLDSSREFLGSLSTKQVRERSCKIASRISHSQRPPKGDRKSETHLVEVGYVSSVVLRVVEFLSRRTRERG